jgi:hypothetical protein
VVRLADRSSGPQRARNRAQQNANLTSVNMIAYYHVNVLCRRSDSHPEAAPEQRVERVIFLTAELDAMVDGLRRATDVLAALATPLPGPIVPACSLPHIPAGRRPRTHLRLVE